MDIIDAVYHRRAVRDFADVPVDRDAIRFVIDAAIHAPNAMNRQPWSFTVVSNRTVLDRCSNGAKAHSLALLSGNPHLARFRENLASPEFNIFYNAPALIVISATAADQMAQQDCCLAAENLMLAAYERGLGTCWIGFAESWLNQSEGKDMLKIPTEHIAVAPIIIGHPRGDHPTPPRRAPHITWVEG